MLTVTDMNRIMSMKNAIQDMDNELLNDEIPADEQELIESLEFDTSVSETNGLL